MPSLTCYPPAGHAIRPATGCAYIRPVCTSEYCVPMAVQCLLCSASTWIIMHGSVQVHTYDHTLTPEVQAAVAGIPGVEFHPLGLTG